MDRSQILEKKNYYSRQVLIRMPMLDCSLYIRNIKRHIDGLQYEISILFFFTI